MLKVTSGPFYLDNEAASSMIATGRLSVYATENAALCRVKQLSKNVEERTQESEELEELLSAIDQPFQTSTEEPTQPNNDLLLLGEALMVREQRARAAQLYKMSYRGRCGLLISRACLRMGGLSMLRGVSAGASSTISLRAVATFLLVEGEKTWTSWR
ncbi:hypothetical protein GQ600_23218 [Phytophthora cactorum]|nr:hypothetical protein GQ600_23218 [Phytophthora cactorum]